ncbi:hypothetical protein H6G33_07440 [Calothrix sp. FACHB-1219]|uniref:hypothetical protein n=1 Tax=unclassified Calothrix TaxID=2619626 RepID=UPI001685C392|nr:MULTISPECIES: hypothetical protein [unclassified Calothrix]MBD2204628.1 hypothetical protein [Calothrix sp. FACHB-168]MBD2216860.1 hypothetical protein [Calothrix sp. FACHB-1219]
MIHHISIPAENPLKVAQVLSELWQGQVARFVANPGSYVVFKLDQLGTLIEVYPSGTELVPGNKEQQVSFAQNSDFSKYTAIHAAISVSIPADEIIAIAQREGWRALKCDRDGLFTVIEFWLENRLLLELLPPDFGSEYLSFMQPQTLQQFLAKLNTQLEVKNSLVAEKG